MKYKIGDVLKRTCKCGSVHCNIQNGTMAIIILNKTNERSAQFEILLLEKRRIWSSKYI